MGITEIRLITFRVGEQLLALPLDRVCEVIRNVAVSPSPAWSGLLHGIVDFRGEVVPVLDLRIVLGNDEPCDTRKTRIIIVEMLERMAGIIVDQVDNIAQLSQGRLVPLSSISWDKKSTVVAGVAKIRDNLYLVLDIDQLVHEEERKIFKDICLRLKNDETSSSAKSTTPTQKPIEK